MPVTINGIGTRYAGRANVSVRRGTCEFCRRTTTLTSYDTREFFCVIFIPLVPMTKYRIFDYCSSCRKHRRAPQEQFAKSVEATLTPLRDTIRRDPRDADARQQLIGELARLRMITDAKSRRAPPSTRCRKTPRSTESPATSFR